MDFITESGCKKEPVLLQVQPRFADRGNWESLAQKKNLFYEPLELSMGPQSEEMLQWYQRSGRVRSLHGNFIDVNPASGDEDYRLLSQYKCHESCKLAKELGADRVVFHSSIFPYLSGAYLENWVSVCADFYSMLSETYHLTICVENSMDLDPEPLYRLMKKMNGGIDWVCVCLDIGHANYSRAGLNEWFDMLGEYPLGILPNSEQTWFKGYKYYGGFEYNRISGNNITVINVVSLTDYIKGVIPYEVNPNWPIEAQKAQALCAKCYTVKSLGKHKTKGFDLCNTTDCQMYQGTNNATATSDEAVEATEGLFVLYDGEICTTYYHASSGGYTEDAGNIWGKDIPYLKAVEDTYLKSTRPFSVTLDLEQITWILQAKGLIADAEVEDLYVSKYSDVGNVLALTVELDNGTTKTFTGDRARTALNSATLGVTIGSHRYTINGGSTEDTVNINGTQVELGDLYAQGDGKKAKSIDMEDGMVALTANGIEEVTITEPTKIERDDGIYVINGTGSGHNIGLSQEGARSMAEEGFDFEEIIEFYFTDAEVDYYDPN